MVPTGLGAMYSWIASFLKIFFLLSFKFNFMKKNLRKKVINVEENIQCWHMHRTTK